MNILLTNDDGVHARGLNVLKKELEKIGNVLTIAPLEERSSCGHALSLGRPIRMQQIDDQTYGLSGYPADCVLMAHEKFNKEFPIDVVVSGINHGANLGQDVYYSGTVSAAREATVQGYAGIAISLALDHYQKDDEIHFETAAKYLSLALKKNIHKMITKDSTLNINVPNFPLSNVKDVLSRDLSRKIYHDTINEYETPRGEKYYFIGGHYKGHCGLEKGDSLGVENGNIVFTELGLLKQNLNKNNDLLQTMKDVL